MALPHGNDSACSRIEELLSAAQDGATSPAEKALIERHLAGCPACRATAEAYRRNDERLLRYLQGTPVPPIAAPWRAAPPQVATGRPATHRPGRGQVALAGLALIALLLVGTTWLVQRLGGTTGESAALQQASGRAVQEAEAPAAGASTDLAAARATVTATAGSAPAAAAGRASTAPATAAAAGAVAPAATRAASEPATTGAGAVAASPPAPTPAPGQQTTTASPASGTATPGPAVPPAAARQATAAVTPASVTAGGATVNLARRYALAEATRLALCRPEPLCQEQLLAPEGREAVVRALDRDLAALPLGAHPTPAASERPSDRANLDYLTLTFDLPGDRQVAIGYDRRANLLLLPDDAGWAVAPPELAAALAAVGIEPPR